VLEPLSGYLLLARRLLADDGRAWAEAWNFGPAAEGVATVQCVADALVAAWGGGRISGPQVPPTLHEAQRLALDCSKAGDRLGWRPRWDTAEAVRRTAAWYRAFADGTAAAALCQQDLEAYRQAGQMA
jgi:CDP-glucose 4,6-dehydratase